MSENADFIRMLRQGDWYEGDVNYDDLLKAANIIEELGAQLAGLREALTSISTALDAYGVRWCRDVAKEALLQESSDD